MITAATVSSLNPGKYAQAKLYARIERRLWLADTLFRAAFFQAWLPLGWAKSLTGWFKTYTLNDWLLVPGFDLPSRSSRWILPIWGMCCACQPAILSTV